MSADPTTTPAPPSTRPIPVSSPSDHEPPPRYRWVAPLFIGVALGAVLGGGVTFTMMALSIKSRGDLVAKQFDVRRVVAGMPGDVHVNGDSTNDLGSYGRRGTSTAIRRRIELVGQVPADTNLSTLANQLKTQVDAELNQAGSYSTGGGSSTSSGGNEFHGSFESTYYTRDGRRGQMDLQIEARGTSFRATLLLFEAK